MSTQPKSLPSNALPSPTVSSNNSEAGRKSEQLERLRALLTEPGAQAQFVELATRGRKPGPLAHLPNTQRYAAEKRTGLRRENGSLKLKRLTARHYRIIGLRLEGKSLEQICQEVRITIGTASRVLNDPLATAILKRVYASREGEIEALAGRAIDATRKALAADDLGTNLRGVDRFLKIRDSMIDKEKGRESAEDVVARLLENATINGDVNVQVNQSK